MLLLRLVDEERRASVVERILRAAVRVAVDHLEQAIPLLRPRLDRGVAFGGRRNARLEGEDARSCGLLNLTCAPRPLAERHSDELSIREAPAVLDEAHVREPGREVLEAIAIREVEPRLHEAPAVGTHRGIEEPLPHHRVRHAVFGVRLEDERAQRRERFSNDPHVVSNIMPNQQCCRAGKPQCEAFHHGVRVTDIGYLRGTTGFLPREAHHFGRKLRGSDEGRLGV